ncbi:hypothetical protein [Leptolyngbya sp. NIES-2104]|nr:hypothetical protein [Leptolyngbya sp. NIES-2104]GAP96621.1 hypothetical protein NIES2104_31640 [Leptolyngbya sp. NIES-2104]
MDVHQVVRDVKGSMTVEQMVQHVYGIEDGLIKRMEIEPIDP